MGGAAPRGGNFAATLLYNVITARPLLLGGRRTRQAAPAHLQHSKGVRLPKVSAGHAWLERSQPRHCRLERTQFMAANVPAFDVGDYLVYPKHGVGRVVELQSQDIAGMKLELYALRFEKE